MGVASEKRSWSSPLAFFAVEIISFGLYDNWTNFRRDTRLFINDTVRWEVELLVRFQALTTSLIHNIVSFYVVNNTYHTTFMITSPIYT